MDSLAQSGRISSNGDRGSAAHSTEKLIGNQNANVPPRDHPMLQTAHQEVKKTHYPYKEPRIDQRMYQAEIPCMQGRSSNRAVTRGSSSPRTGERHWRCNVWLVSLLSAVYLCPLSRRVAVLRHVVVVSYSPTGQDTSECAACCTEQLCFTRPGHIVIYTRMVYRM